VFTLVATALALVYYFAPDVQQRLIWIMPGSVFATAVWLLASLGFKWYVSEFANYQKTYGAIGGVMVALLWLYVSGLAILMGAEMNAVIEHASPMGKNPGEKAPGEHERAGASTGERSLRHALAPAAATRRQPAGLRVSDAVVGAIAIGIELQSLAVYDGAVNNPVQDVPRLRRSQTRARGRSRPRRKLSDVCRSGLVVAAEACHGEVWAWNVVTPCESNTAQRMRRVGWSDKRPKRENMENEDHGSKQDQLEDLFPVPTKLGKGLARVKRATERHPDFDERHAGRDEQRRRAVSN
jgi:Virulence factor BrkB